MKDEVKVGPNLEVLKERHGAIYEVVVSEANEDGTDEVFIFREPNRAELKAATKMGMNDPLAGSEVIIENCLVFGNRELLEKTGVFLAVSEHLDVIIGKKVSAIKKQ